MNVPNNRVKAARKTARLTRAAIRSVLNGQEKQECDYLRLPYGVRRLERRISHQSQERQERPYKNAGRGPKPFFVLYETRGRFREMFTSSSVEDDMNSKDRGR